MLPQIFVINGHIIDQITGLGLPGLRVEAWDRDANRDDPLGEAITDAEGHFSIRFDPSKFDDNVQDPLPDLYFKIFSGDKPVHNSRSRPLRDWTQHDKLLVIEIDAQPAGEEQEPFVVTGRVLHADGPPVSSVQVQAVHKTLRSEVPLGEPSRPDDLGRYAIRYLPPEGVEQVDLIVRAVEPGTNDRLAESELICNPQRIEQVDLIIGGSQYRGYSEWERLNQALEPHLDGVSWVELTTADIEFLECVTQRDPFHIAYLVIARWYALKTEVPAAAYYGFFRMNLPARLPALVSQPRQVQRDALAGAVQANIVPAHLEQGIEAILGQLKQTAVKLALEIPEGQETTSLPAILETTGLTAGQQGALLAKYSLHEGPVEEFWESLKSDADLNDGMVGRLQLNLQLGALTGGYAPLVEQLQDRAQNGQIGAVKDLVAYQPGDWLDLIQESGVRPGIPGETEQQRARNYAEFLAQTVEQAFPTEAVVAGLRRRNAPGQQDLLRFFDNSPDYQFSDNIDRYLRENSETALDGISDVEKLTRELKEYQRLYRVAPQTGRFEAITALQRAGLDSAQAIVRMGKGSFMRSVGESVGGEAVAESIYARAGLTHAITVNTFGKFSTALATSTPAVIRNLAITGAGLPTWESLFGSLSFCECEHCRSVYSPAAYFVDLLQFIKQQPAISILPGGIVTYPMITEEDGSVRPKTALDVLFERRPDLGEIELSCENTNTLLPYIDLVNEVLENAVYPQPGVFQTTWTEEELAANSEHLNEMAYHHLSQEVYPRLLPFNLWIEEGRAYLGHLGVSLVELMRVIHRPGLNGPGLRELDQRIAIESLGLSPTAARIITGTLRPTRAPWKFWGVSQAQWPGALADVPTFLRQAELSLGALEELIATQFINGDRSITIQFETACNIEGAEIQNLTEEILDRMQRFLRLQRALGWEIAELDETLAAMQTTDLTMQFLVQASQIQTLKTQLNLSHLEVLSWWANISTRVDERDEEDRSLYEQLFLNNAVLSPIDEAFTLDALASGDEPLGEHTAVILAALAVSDEDLALILEAENLTESDALTLEHLSQLYRNASLAKALGMVVKDFLSLRAMTGIDPFSNPQTTLDFVDEAQAVEASAFTLASLDYLLRHVYIESSGLYPTDSSITLILDDLKAGLETIAAENSFAPDPTGALTQARLALVLAGDDLAKAISILEMTSEKPRAAQAAFIDKHFAVFLDTADAQAQLLGPNALKDRQERYEYVLEPLVSYLKTTFSIQFVVQSNAAALNLEEAVAKGLLTRYVDTPDDPALKAMQAFLQIPAETEVYSEALLNTYRLLDKIATVLNTLEVQAEEMDWVFEAGLSLGWLDLAHLPVTVTNDPVLISRQYNGWKRLEALYTFRDQYPPAGDVTLFGILDLLRDGSDRTTTLLALSALTGWDYEDLNYLTGPGGFDLTFPEDYRSERYLLHLQAAMDLLQRLGVSVEAAAAWQVDEDPERMKATAREIKSTAKAKYDNATWLSIAETIKNALREKQRDALVAYLLTQEAGIEQASDLFERYLIDAEMSACMETSRIKQAISSVQLFMQRGLMNLELSVEFNQDAQEQWLWMKNYRVWEANRKVFLYPENWIVPELRDDKSPFFEELESELLQHAVTDEVVETAFLHYLEQLKGVANLDIRALCHQKESGDDPVDVLHVLARTYATPHHYYYRQKVDGSYWTAWQRLDLDIEGDHLLAVTWNRRLYLFWFVIQEGDEESNVQWEIEAAWSEYWDGQWLPAKRAEKPLTINQSITIADYQIFFKPQVSSDSTLTILCHSVYRMFSGEDVPYEYRYTHGRFLLKSCNDRVVVPTSVRTSAQVFPSPNTEPEYMHFVADSPGVPLTLATAELDEQGIPIFSTIEFVQILGSSPAQIEAQEQFVLAWPHQYDEFVLQDSFFYQDSERSFLIEPQYRSFLERSSIALQDKSQVSFDLVLEASVNLFNAGSAMGAGSSHIQTQHAQPGRQPAALTGGAPKSTVELFDWQYEQIDNLLAESTLVSNGTSIQVGQPVIVEPEKIYEFSNHYHPYVCTFIKELKAGGIDGLMQRALQASTGDTELFQTEYAPVENVVRQPYPVENVDFSEEGAYALYNWELLFHAPLLIATRLSQEQRFEEAQRWFHFIFNPLMRADSPSVSGPERYWVFYPFYLENTEQTIEELMLELNAGDAELANQVAQWRENPFNPHLIARLRPIAYQKTVVMKYLDNLIAWGDYLFSQDTIESINEATQLYVLAANILGPRPQSLPANDPGAAETYNSLEDRLDGFSNAFVQLEIQIPDLFSFPQQTDPLLSGFDPLQLPDLPSWLHGRTIEIPVLDTLYFCIPGNDQLFTYWDTVEDRLFKIRHCMNIAGLVRDLPLFEPQIDPALLVQATALGIDLASVLNDLYAPLPAYRFQFVLQKAIEFCSDVRSLGGALLAALEKQDAEELALLRSNHENQLLEAIRQLKEQQVEEARESLEALQRGRDTVNARLLHYQGLILRIFNESELSQFHQLAVANTFQILSQASFATSNTILSVASGIKAFSGDPGAAKEMVGYAAQASSHVFSAISIQHTFNATKAGLNAGYQRRAEDWVLQINLAAKELEQIDKQIVAAEIRVAIAELDRDHTNQQIEHAQEVYDYLQEKYTNQQLYSWMVSEVSSIYFQSYQMAYDLGKRAEQAYRHELGLTDSNFVQYGYWDSLKKGLLSGEKLNHDLRRMELSYLDLNQREYEITKHVSLRQLDPLALLSLKATGACEVTIPEWLYDLDNPGHYLRRIKNASLSLPAVTGPYTSVNCTLTLQKSSVRTSSLLKNGQYARQGSEDDRFVDSYGAIQSIVTSNGNYDSGLFETNLRDERYLPFEGAGAESTWSLELPAAFRPFDYNTLSDVILHIRYTARPGGTGLRDKAVENLETLLQNASEAGLAMLFSLRHDFPTEWHQFLSGSGDFTATVKRDYFPYFTQGRAITINAIQLHAIQDDRLENVIPQGLDLTDMTGSLEADGAFVLSLAPDEAVLVREQQAYVFALIEYSIAQE